MCKRRLRGRVRNLRTSENQARSGRSSPEPGGPGRRPISWRVRGFSRNPGNRGVRRPNATQSKGEIQRRRGEMREISRNRRANGGDGPRIRRSGRAANQLRASWTPAGPCRLAGPDSVCIFSEREIKRRRGRNGRESAETRRGQDACPGIEGAGRTEGRSVDPLRRPRQIAAIA